MKYIKNLETNEDRVDEMGGEVATNAEAIIATATPDSANHPMVKVGTKIDVINPDFFEGDEKEEGCEIVSIKPTRGLSPEIIVKLASDPSIRCKVEWQHGRWVILENVIENK